jgi:hypothetical protein
MGFWLKEPMKQKNNKSLSVKIERILRFFRSLFASTEAQARVLDKT